MTQRPNTPSTSRAAHESIKPAKSYYHEKIIEGLRKLKVGGTFEEIAEASGIQPSQAWKRLSEMQAAGLVYNVGTTRKTSSGRQAQIRQLTEFSREQELQTFLNELQNEGPLPVTIQKELF